MKPVNVVCAFFSTLCILSVYCADDLTDVDNFEVRPGGEKLEHKKEWDGFTCKFTYQCQGGTKENWVMSINRNSEKRKFVCTIERPDGMSYLFFQHFEASIEGADAVEIEVYGPHGKDLKSEEYTVDLMNRKVTEGSKFSSQLDKIVIYALKPQEEL
ncbi:hypothetical protein CHS0354_022015 [Potamilus streckersoni]|uniref:Myeloid-derived growth factor n=1 Tax=Potamilus streckersoni TaxID=2493646 RepID=A0AAE0T202_9BIVA|nr:hypothetical protein CHS0354_022015 [Potamilus streckersoni]